jgi:AcrR family transcriptional regulator
MSENKKQNRQTIRSRRLLQEALVTLLQEKPYKKITILDITEEADLARSTFYAHFDTKEQLLISYVDDLLDQFFEMLDARDYIDPDIEADIRINISFFQIWDECCSIEEVIKAVDIDNLILYRFRRYWEKNYEASISKHIPELNPELAKYLNNYLACSYFGILKIWLRDDKKHPPEIMGQLLYDLTGPPILEKIVTDFKDKIV